MTDLLSQSEARELVDEYIERDDKISSTQEILDSGAIPRLEGYVVRPGKVSDSIFGGHEGNPALESREGLPLRLMVRTQRISTHDLNRGEIPFKDQILAVNHNYMRRMLSDAIGTSQLEIEGSRDNSVVIVAEDLTQIPFENVLRDYMATSTTSTNMGNQYLNKGVRNFGGHNLPEGLIANCKLPFVMDTPSTKSEEHDETINPDYLFRKGICTPEQYAEIINSSIFAFGMVSQFLRGRGLIAVDTKTEQGINTEGQIVSQDEIWTMDSSRFWLRDDYNEQLKKLEDGEIEELNPRSYSKEFARGFSKGDEGYTDEQRAQIAVRYIEGIQHLLGKRFEPDMRSSEERIVSGLEEITKGLVA